jgi:putative transposase
MTGPSSASRENPSRNAEGSVTLQGYTEKIQPQVGSTWRTDEMFVKIKGNMKYLFAMMDDETRFRIAQQVSTFKGTSDVRPMFKEAQARARKKPRVLISDGAPNFALANKKEWTNRYAGQSTQHIAEIRMEGKVHNTHVRRQAGPSLTACLLEIRSPLSA